MVDIQSQRGVARESSKSSLAKKVWYGIFSAYHHERHHHHQNDPQGLPVRKIQGRQPTSCFSHPLLLHSEEMGIGMLIRMMTIYILCGFVCHEKSPLSEVSVCLSVTFYPRFWRWPPKFECLGWRVNIHIYYDKVSLCLWSFIFTICSTIWRVLSRFLSGVMSFCLSRFILTIRSTIKTLWKTAEFNRKVTAWSE